MTFSDSKRAKNKSCIVSILPRQEIKEIKFFGKEKNDPRCKGGMLLIRSKVDFRSKNIYRDKDDHFTVIMRSNHQ